MSSQGKPCDCGNIKKPLLFACSGGADVGQLTDLAARKIMRDGCGSMLCTAGLGGRVDLILSKAQMAKLCVTIDGCPLDCARRCFELAGVSGDMVHIRLSDFGYIKGETEVDDETVGQVADIVCELVKEMSQTLKVDSE